MTRRWRSASPGLRTRPLIWRRARAAPLVPGCLAQHRRQLPDAPPEVIAIRQVSDGGDRREVTYGELEHLSGRVAAGLAAAGLAAGESVGVFLPMTVEAVAALLGILRAGCVAVLVAESFAAPEVEQRLRFGGARLVITQDAIVRRGERLGLSSKLAGCPIRAVVVSTGGESRPALRPGDLTWDEFRHRAATSRRSPVTRTLTR